MKVGAAFVQTLASQVFQSAMSLATGVMIARGLGPAGQGQYATFAAGVALGALIASLGQFHGNVLAAADQQAAPRVLLLRAALHGTAVFTLLAVIVLLGGQLLTAEPPRTLLAFLFVLVLSLEAVAEMVRGINLGQHHVAGWQVVGLTQRIVYFSAVGLIALRFGLSLQSVVTCWALATALTILVNGGWIWFRDPRIRVSLRGIWTGWSRRLALGMRAFVTIGFTLLLIRADIWMLGPMLGESTVGQVSVATYLGEWFWYVPSILGNLMFAVVAAEVSRRSALQVARTARLVTGLLATAMVLLLLLGRSLVGLLYGPVYHEAGILFTILLPGMTALGIHLVVDSYFAGSGFPPVTIWGALAAVVAKVGLNLVAVPKFGVVGAVAVTSIVYIGLLGLKVIWFVRTTGIRAVDVLVVNASDVAYLKQRIRLLAPRVRKRALGTR